MLLAQAPIWFDVSVNRPCRRLGAAPRRVRTLARLRQRGSWPGRDRKRFMRRAGGLFGAARDLLHGAPQLFGGGGRFGDAACQFFAGCRDPLLDFLLAAGGGRRGRLPHGSSPPRCTGGGPRRGVRDGALRVASAEVFISDFGGRAAASASGVGHGGKSERQRSAAQLAGESAFLGRPITAIGIFCHRQHPLD